jgi:hypothetical protein
MTTSRIVWVDLDGIKEGGRCTRRAVCFPDLDGSGEIGTWFEGSLVARVTSDIYGDMVVGGFSPRSKEEVALAIWQLLHGGDDFLCVRRIC